MLSGTCVSPNGSKPNLANEPQYYYTIRYSIEELKSGQATVDVIDELDNPRARNAEAKRRAILDGAKRIFLRHGFEGSSMDGVAAASGVSKMTVYRYFAGTDQRLYPAKL